MLLAFSIPAAIVGSLIADDVNANLLRTIFAIGIILIGIQLFKSYRDEARTDAHATADTVDQPPHESQLIDAQGRVFHYTVCDKHLCRFFALVGGWFVGMISVGLAELQEYHLLVRCRVPPPVAVATSVFIVVVTVLVASGGHFYNFVTEADRAVLSQVLSIVMFTIPGVVIGGQLGPLVQAKVDPHQVKLGIAVLFTAVGGFMFATVL